MAPADAADRELMPTVRVNDITMYHEHAGSGEPPVLIGGLGLDVSECRNLIEALAGHHRVLAFDNPGPAAPTSPMLPTPSGRCPTTPPG